MSKINKLHLDIFGIRFEIALTQFSKNIDDFLWFTKLKFEQKQRYHLVSFCAYDGIHTNGIEIFLFNLYVIIHWDK